MSHNWPFAFRDRASSEMPRAVSIFHRLGAPLVRAAADASLPQDCLLCGTPAASSLICTECNAQMPRLPAALCPVCALPSPGSAVCGACLKTPPHYDATLASFAYEFPVDRVIQALKYGAELAAIPFLADALADCPHVDADLVAPLPLHRARLRTRGFNQALEIARRFAARLDLPLAVAICERTHDSAPQASLPWGERQRNVRGAFLCRVDLSGKHVVAVDDVMTTGATLNEFARTLKHAGAAHVTNLVVARTLP